ncbi:MAG TPA: glutamate formimidoyltransferase [Myxococcota bacterium]|nr:glutamate formimidoyltransferase [Myxococcota bacterium]
MKKCVECVPNFSEGRNRDVINAITGAMERAGAVVLDVDMGAAAHRTVVTMAGEPEKVLSAAFEAIRTAASLIDMSSHHGEHPRMGATDVCPFVPIEGVSMQECVELARRLGQRVGDELGIPVFLYEEAATRPERRSLADIRSGEYEALPTRLTNPEWAPDFGPAAFNARSGATVIGAREFLIAYNVNINSRDKVKASRMAIRMREGAGPARGSDGEKILGPDGEWFRVPGALKNIRAVGWTIEEYGVAQVSINILNYRKTPIHAVYEEAKRQAEAQGVCVTGSEIVGLVPADCLLAAGRYYLERQGLCPAAPDSELIHIACRSLGLSDVKVFCPADKVVEYRMKAGTSTLIDMKVDRFCEEVSADSAVPGGGSVAALAGALGAGLTAMVGNLSFRRPELETVRSEFTEIALEAQALRARLQSLVVEDSAAFTLVMDAMRMPKTTPEEIAARKAAMAAANERATMVPFETLKLCARASTLAARIVEIGYVNCLSDGGTGAAMALAGAEGAAMNVLINLSSSKDLPNAAQLRDEAATLLETTRRTTADALEKVRARLG